MALMPKTSVKRLMIDRAQATMLVIISITVFIVTFSLVASKALISQSKYQSRVLKEKTVALDTLKSNVKNVNQLVESYKSFASEKENILGGDPLGTGVRDGDNPKIVLDALPSKYDYPALMTSLEKLFVLGGYKLEALGGTDDEIAQQNASTDNPEPIEVPFPLSVSANYQGTQDFILLLERSIRPIKINNLTLTVSDQVLTVSLDAKTFYQPSKTFNITKKVVK